MILVIGSRALVHNLKEECEDRRIGDLDLITTPSVALEFLYSLGDDVSDISIKSEHKLLCKSKKFKQIEIELVKDSVLDGLNSSGLYLKESLSLSYKIDSAPEILGEFKGGFATKEILFSIKKSHITHPINFFKHIKDYHILGKSLNYIDSLTEITEVRKKETDVYFKRTDKKVNLNRNLDEFFNESVDRIFVHDDIHEVVAREDRPAYTFMQEENQQTAVVKKSLWEKMTFERKLNTVIEEATVISLERYIIPVLYGKKVTNVLTSKQAFERALMRLSTTMSSGWWRDFVIHSYYQVLESYNKNYVEDFLEDVNKGKVTSLIDNIQGLE